MKTEALDGGLTIPRNSVSAFSISDQRERRDQSQAMWSSVTQGSQDAKPYD